MCVCVCHVAPPSLQSLLRKLQPSDVLQLSDTLMQALLAMLATQTGQSGGVQEDAIMTVAVLVEGMKHTPPSIL